MNQVAQAVYIIDDDKSVRTALKRVLTAAGFRVEIFASGREFLSRAADIERGCLIVDIRMPAETGDDIQMYLARSGVDIPVIAISGDDDDETRARARRLGAASFFTKPVDDQALIDAIRWALAS